MTSEADAARYFLIPEVKYRTLPFEIDAERYREVTGREGTPPTQTKEAEAERVKFRSPADEPQHKKHRGP